MKPTTEEFIKRDVIDHLVWDDSVNSIDIRVKVSGSTVSLEGTVASYAEKISAAGNALEVQGVKHVENNLEVRLSDGRETPDDFQITQNVTNAIMWNSKIISTDIDVETKNQVVTLKGVVGTYWEKNEAEDVAGKTYGVLSVVNLLEVQLTKTLVDIDIENDVKKAFKRNILIDEDKINVESNNGIVRITGSVPNYLVKKEAIDIVTYTQGVVNVVDDLSFD